MSQKLADGRLTIFTGRFGSGKTEAAINYAWSLAVGAHFAISSPLRLAKRPMNEGNAADVVLVDLDIVTPYFRSREMAKVMGQQGVKVIAPAITGLHLDTPALTPQILGAIEDMRLPTVLDVGGDRQGARALGGYSAAVQRRGYTMHFVVNPFRPFSGSARGLASSIGEIEASARLKVTSLVSNPNLMGETTAHHIHRGHVQIEQFAQDLGLPIAFVCVERRWMSDLGIDHFAQPVLPLERFFVQPWE